jgi:HEAT repeat protein
MSSWPLGLKVGVGVAAALLVMVLWVSLRRPSQTPPQPKLASDHQARVQERLARLRQEFARRRQSDTGERHFQERSLPRGRPALPAPPPPAVDVPAEPPMFEEEPDFEELKRLAVSDPDPENRLVAVVLLGTSENPEALPVLTQALNDKDQDVRMTAIETLADFSGPEPVEAIQRALDDPSPEVRFEALGVLADIGGEAAIAAVEKALNDEDEDVRALAEGVLDLEEMYHRENPDEEPAAE